MHGLALQRDAPVRAPAQVPQGAPEDVVEPHGGAERAMPRRALQGIPEGVDEGGVESPRIGRACLPAGGSLGALAV
ncbi:hypothetical protein, partial [Methylobacterium jeotgali]|uniref:hypothetical protein n=1 Tax=Methylobacterium jeotgali TaxID=381630 RepID=UPI001EE2D286